MTLALSMPVMPATADQLAAAPSPKPDMNLFQACVYGVVQGLTEFLPISSTAHLRIVPALFGWDDPGAPFTAVIQLGTTLAVILYFWRELAQVVIAWTRGLVDKSVRDTLEYRMGWYLVVATIPVGVFGVAFSHQIETGARNLWIISVTMIALAFALALAEKVGARNREEEDLDSKDAIAVGTAQALSLIPGASRSGTTITAGLFRGLNRETAARFSFLLSIPAVLSVGALRVPQDRRQGRDRGGPHRRRVGHLLHRGPGFHRVVDALPHAAHYLRVHLLPDRTWRSLLIILLLTGVISATSN